MASSNNFRDPIIKFIIKELRLKHHCHTAILYGSRARGDATRSSDYDVMGVTQMGQKFRIAKKKNKYGTRFLKRLEKVVKSDPRPLSRDEIEVKKVWAKKILERASVKDIEGHYRRIWLQYALLEDYFVIRRQKIKE